MRSLAPEIVERIFAGDEPEGIGLGELRANLPVVGKELGSGVTTSITVPAVTTYDLNPTRPPTPVCAFVRRRTLTADLPPLVGISAAGRPFTELLGVHRDALNSPA